MMDEHVGRVVVAPDDLQQRIAELGKEITADYQGRPPLLVGVLKGAFVFMSDLARAIDLPVEFDFMAVSSYGSATKSSGVVRIVKDLDIDLTGRDVLLVEDIIDSGLTLSWLRENLGSRGAASTDPDTVTSSASTPYSASAARVDTGYAVATRRPARSASACWGAPVGTAASSVQRAKPSSAS